MNDWIQTFATLEPVSVLVLLILAVSLVQGLRRGAQAQPGTWSIL